MLTKKQGNWFKIQGLDMARIEKFEEVEVWQQARTIAEVET